MTNEFGEIANKLIEEEKNNKIITYHKKYEDCIRTKYIKAYGTEGLEFIDQDLIKKQRAIFTYMIKKIGSNLLSNKSMRNISMPINIYDSKSEIEE